METTPRTQPSTPLPPEPPADAPPLEHFRYAIAGLYSRPLSLRLEAFAISLPAYEVRELQGLVAMLDTEVSDRVARDTEAEWLAVFRHLGMLPAAKILHAHCLGMYINCNAADCAGYAPAAGEAPR